MPEPAERSGTPPSGTPDSDLEFLRSRLGGNRKLLLAIVAVGTVGAGLFTLLVPPEYEARASIVMPAGESGGGALGLAAQLGVVPASAGSSSANLAMFASILDSERMLNVLSEKSGVPKAKLRERKSVKQSQQSNLIEVKFRSGDSKQALSLCQGALDALKGFNSELQLPTKSQRAKLLADKIDDHMGKLRELEIRFQKFAKTSKSVPTGLGDEKSEVNIFTQKQRLGQLRSELTSLVETEKKASAALGSIQTANGQVPTDAPQLQRTYDELRGAERDLIAARATYTDQMPLVRNLQAKVDTLRGQLRTEASRYAQSFEKGLVKDVNQLRVSKKVIQDQIRELEIQVEAAPFEATEFERLKREMKYIDNVLLELTVKHEQALMDEATDPNRWEVLDKPELADKPVNKKFGLSLGIGFAASLFLGILVALSIRPKA